MKTQILLKRINNNKHKMKNIRKKFRKLRIKIRNYKIFQINRSK